MPGRRVWVWCILGHFVGKLLGREMDEREGNGAFKGSAVEWRPRPDEQDKKAHALAQQQQLESA